MAKRKKINPALLDPTHFNVDRKYPPANVDFLQALASLYWQGNGKGDIHLY